LFVSLQTNRRANAGIEGANKVRASNKPSDSERQECAIFDWRAHLKIHPAAELFPLMKDKDPDGF
jgi:hypothetical protein